MFVPHAPLPVWADKNGFAELLDYLTGPRDRAATLSRRWPIDLGPVVDEEEFSRPWPAALSNTKQMWGQLPYEEQKIYKAHEPLASLEKQFAECARWIRDYAAPSTSLSPLFWKSSLVKAGEKHFAEWHTDGNVYVEEASGIWTARTHVLPILATDRQFYPADILLQAVNTMPTRFASGITKLFDKDSVAFDPKGEELFNPERFVEALKAMGGALTSAPCMRIVVFPSGVAHTGTDATEDTQRRIAVRTLPLILKSHIRIAGF